MNESEFLKTLEKRATEQEKLIRGILFPKIFLSLSLWLGNHPMRIIIPLAIILTLILRNLFGQNYYNFILKIFGKL
jgi:hypothetical protein